MNRSQEYFERALAIPDELVPPIFVPSYNRPNPRLFKQLATEPELKIVLCIRREQYDLYKHWEGKVYSFMLLDGVSDIGETRQQIIERVGNFYDQIFMFDDDINELNYYIPSVTSGGSLSRRASHLVTGFKPRYTDILKLWMYYISQSPYEIAMSGITYRPDGWNIKHEDRPLLYNSGEIRAVAYISTKLLHEHNLNYKSNKIVGAEDYALQFDVMSAGLVTLKLLDILFNCPEVNETPGGCENMLGFKDPIARYHHMFDIEKQHYGEHPGILYSTNRSKTIPSVKLNWRYWRQQFENHHTK